MPAEARGFPPLSDLGDRWVERRRQTHRAWRDDESRWKCHVRPFFGGYRAAEVDAALLRRFVEDRLAWGLNPTTVGLCMRLVSTLFADLAERPRETGTNMNPVRTVPRSTRRLYRPSHDWRKTPYLKSLDDVARVFRALDAAGHEQTAVAFALGVFAMLRTGEVVGLSWSDLDLERREITIARQVNRSQVARLKDDEVRTAPIQAALVPVLTAYRQKTGGDGFLFHPDRPNPHAGKGSTPSAFVRPSTLNRHLREALGACHLPGLTWYQATRHTGASGWVRNGGSLEKLALAMGHSSTEVTRRYAHLAPDAFGEAESRLLSVDLTPKAGTVSASKAGSIGQSLASRPQEAVHGNKEFTWNNDSLRP